MDFRELTYVLAIAKHQNLSKAAQELYVSQPTLSKFVQGLEAQLNLKLFSRLGNQFRLTYAGQRYVDRARQILSIKRQLDQELDDIGQREIGELTVALTPMRSVYLLPQVLPAFRRRHPNIQLHILEGNSGLFERMLLEGEVDLAFFSNALLHPKLTCEALAKEELVLLLSADHPLAGEGTRRPNTRFPWLDIARLAGEEFLLPTPDQRTRATIEGLLRSRSIHPKALLELASVPAAANLAARGYGVYVINSAYLRPGVISPHLKTVCFSIGNPSLTTDFMVASRKGVYQPQHVRDFIDLVQEASVQAPRGAERSLL